WVPLRSSEFLEVEGAPGRRGYQKEFFGLGSVSVPLNKREAASQLSWGDIGLINEQRVWASEASYKPVDVYQRRSGEDLGIELVLVQSFDGDEPREWHLNQDLVFALSLMREGDQWIRPRENYALVARLR